MADSAEQQPAEHHDAASAEHGSPADAGENSRKAKNQSRRGRDKKMEKAAAAVAANEGGDDAEDGGDGDDPRTRAPKCKQCHKQVADLYRDKKDGKLYCAPCWKAWYKRAPPASARFKRGAPRAGGNGHAAEEEEPIGQPIAPEHVDVDQFYEGVLREGAPAVFVGKDKIAWSVLLKGAKDKFAYALLQLITHDDCCVVYSRTGRVNEGADNAKEVYHEFPGKADALHAAKDKFGEVFFEFTKNRFEDVKRCVTKFVTRAEYTLMADVKAARRAENEANRIAREAKERALIDERNAQIVASVKAELGADGGNGHGAAASKKEAKPANKNANGNNNDGLSHATIRPEDKRKSPKPAPIQQPADNGAEDGELSPAEPPCTPAVAPQPTAAPVSPQVKAKPTAAPAKSAAKMPTPPAAPRPGPAAAPKMESQSAKPAASASTAAKPAAAAAPAAAPQKAKKMVVNDANETSSGSTIAIVAGVVAVAAVAGFLVMRKKDRGGDRYDRAAKRRDAWAASTRYHPHTTHDPFIPCPRAAVVSMHCFTGQLTAETFLSE
eukprot:CAMPEP_0174828752 /NCGR_PEP_ID=MMETSP1114-20130205/1518_1 /TAXON_ID=312471 /ORGANISM="Neobodo designis, Strain CCAP 1951/1" /LENGTH=551 /DNA_ID=CAMNT_0016062477 /DNA_START=27 /DNA_END=1680 /DNA_ORIENTATION=-